MNNKETIKLIEKIKNLKWNDKNLEKHTKKHPIKESEKYGSYKWGNILGFYDITQDFGKTKKAYKEKSELILSNLSNAIMYYHEGPNKNYCSIGIFEDKERNKDEEILTIFIQCNKNKYFITTSYLRKICFKEKLYFSYELLKRPHQFKLNISTKKFKNKIGIPQEFDFSNLEELTKDLSNDDLILNAYNEYKKYGKLKSSTCQELLYQFNYMLSDLKEIDNKMDLNNQVKQILKELYGEKSSEKLNMVDEGVVKTVAEIIEERYNKIKPQIKHKDVMNKYNSNLKDKTKLSMTSGTEKLEKILDEIYKSNKCNKEEIIKIYEEFIESMKLYLENDKYREGKSVVYTCCEIKYLIEYLEEKNINLYKEKNELKCQMSDDQENNFYLSLYKFLISTHLDFKNKLEDYDFNYNDDIIEILGLNIE